MTEQPLTLSYALHALAFGAGMWAFITFPLWLPKLRRRPKPSNVVQLPDRSNVRTLDSVRKVRP